MNNVAKRFRATFSVLLICFCFIGYFLVIVEGLITPSKCVRDLGFTGISLGNFWEFFVFFLKCVRNFSELLTPRLS